MGMWQVFSNVKYVGATGTCTPGDYSIMSSLSFVSYYGEYYKKYGVGPFPVYGGTYSGGLLTDPEQHIGTYGTTSSFYFDISVPLGCPGLVGVDIEIQNPADATWFGYEGALPGFNISDISGNPIDWTTALQYGPTTSGGYLLLNTATPRRTLLGYDPASFTPIGSSTKHFSITFDYDYRIADVKYTLHDVFWRNV
jgi:hypothetical protein